MRDLLLLISEAISGTPMHGKVRLSLMQNFENLQKPKLSPNVFNCSARDPGQVAEPEWQSQGAQVIEIEAQVAEPEADVGPQTRYRVVSGFVFFQIPQRCESP